MKKTKILILLFLSISIPFYAQILPCLPTAGGIPAGNDAPGCLMCSPIYIGSTAGYSPSAPGSNGFPCGTIENNSFLSVVVDQPGNLVATMFASNCLNNQGVQIIIFDLNFNQVSTCFSGASQGIFENVIASGLTPGDTYLIMLDGYAGDICDVRVTVSGSASFSPPPPIGPITSSEPSDDFCPGMTVCFSANIQTNRVVWQYPGNTMVVSGGGEGDDQICLELLSPGGGVVQVAPEVNCFPSIPSLFPISVLPVLPTLKPIVSLCTEEFPIKVDGIVFENPGTYNITNQNRYGCDSVVTYTFLPKVSPPGFIDTTLCAGESLMYNGKFYDKSGSYQVTLPGASSVGCDSVINLTIKILQNQTTILTPDTLDCLPGSIQEITAVNLPATDTSRWTPGLGGSIISGVNSSTVFVDQPGIYYLSTRSNFGGRNCSFKDSVEVFIRPKPLNPTLDTIQNYICNQDTALFLINPVNIADSLVWTFVGLDTFKTEWTDSFYYAAVGRYDTLKISGKNVCGIGAITDTVLNIKPVMAPELEFLAPSVCINEPVFVVVPKLKPDVNFQWELNGGDLNFTSMPDTLELTWATPGQKTVRLNTVQDSCFSYKVSEQVEVYSPFNLNIRCQPSIDQVMFSWNKIRDANSFIGRVNTGQTFIQTDTTLLVTGLIPGESVDVEIEVSGNNPCGSVSFLKSCTAENCPPVTVSIDPISPICFAQNTQDIQLTAQFIGGAGNGVFQWSGSGTVLSGVFSPSVAGIGNHSINLIYSEGNCEYYATALVEIKQTPSSDFGADSPICQNETGTVFYTGNVSQNAGFNWNFASANIINNSGSTNYELNFPTDGIFDISLSVEENGCISPVTTKSILVEKPINPNIVNCSATQSEVIFEWVIDPNASGYSINSISNHTGNINGNAYTVSGLDSDEEVMIEITAESGNSCPDIISTAACTTTNCPSVDLSIDPVSQFCLDGSSTSVQLRARRNSILRPGNYRWAGPGVSLGGLFDPNVAGVGTHQIEVTLTEQNCDYTASITISVFEKPTANFDINPVICETEIGEINYTGSASQFANFNWNFDRATVISGSTQTYVELNFPDAGNYEIQLSVEENGCQSDIFTKQVQVDAPLETPQINCLTSTSEITFEWQNIPGADNIEVVSLSGQSGTQFGNSYTVSGLSPDEEVEILVRADGQTICGSATASASCTAKNCPNVTLNINPVPQPICAGDPVDIMLAANAVGGSGLGNFEWSGANITPDGILSPSTLTGGNYNVLLTYEEDNCRYTQSTVFDIADNPNLDAIVTTPIWYPGTVGDISINAQNAVAPYSFSWSNNSTDNQLSGVPPGDYCLTVTDAIGCKTTDCYAIGSGIYRVKPIEIICAGQRKQISIRPARGGIFNWIPNSGLSCNGCANPVVSPSSSTVYDVIATLTNGRFESTKVIVIVLPSVFCPLLKGDNNLKNLNDDDFLNALIADFEINNIGERELQIIEKRLENIISETDVKVVPNPTSGIVNIQSSLTPENIEIYDFSGKKIGERKSEKIDISFLPKGIYFLKIKTKKSITVKRVILY